MTAEKGPKQCLAFHSIGVTWSDLDLGSLPAWLAGLGTVVALVGLLRLRHREAMAVRISQASKVHVWHDLGRDPSRKLKTQTPIVFSVDNGSDGPIYEVVLCSPVTLGRHLSSARLAVPKVIAAHVRLPKGVVTEEVLLGETSEDTNGGSVNALDGYALVFRDAAGRLWVRHSSGALSEHRIGRLPGWPRWPRGTYYLRRLSSLYPLLGLIRQRHLTPTRRAVHTWQGHFRIEARRLHLVDLLPIAVATVKTLVSLALTIALAYLIGIVLARVS